VPSYIQITEFSFQKDTSNAATGSYSNRISDVWIYVNNQFIGAYSIPTQKIPVLAEGGAKISVQAGVFTDGIRKSRVSYPFYKSFDLDTILVKGQTMVLKPEFEFLPEWKGKKLIKPFSFYQDFEINKEGCKMGEAGNVELKIESHESDPAIKRRFGDNYLKLTTLNNNDVIDVSNDVYLPLESNGNPVYLEFDYKSTCPVQVGLRGKSDNRSLGEIHDLILNPNENWTKIYVSLSEETSRLAPGQKASFIFFLRTLPPPGKGNSLSLDNIRLLN
jgi:hypothetical protein